VRSATELPSSSDDSEYRNGLLAPELADDGASGLDHRFIGVAVNSPEDAWRAAFRSTEAAPKLPQGQGTPAPPRLAQQRDVGTVVDGPPRGARPETVRIGYDADERAASDRVAGTVRGRVVAKIA
jgi:hypothetical protein